MMMINLSGDESVRDGTYKFTSRLDTIGGGGGGGMGDPGYRRGFPFFNISPFRLGSMRYL